MRLTVSAIGRTGIAAPCSAAAAATAAMRLAETSGRAPSWTSDDPVAAGVGHRCLEGLEPVPDRLLA